MHILVPSLDYACPVKLKRLQILTQLFDIARVPSKTEEAWNRGTQQRKCKTIERMEGLLKSECVLGYPQKFPLT